ncbi:MAG: hypothetical protein HYV34_01345 [Candidatus Kerfeldbacteria bacterium]|nr:hypothetical protein [Candidatus Kerfeldbacteria bacterium]
MSSIVVMEDTPGGVMIKKVHFIGTEELREDWDFVPRARVRTEELLEDWDF